MIGAGLQARLVWALALIAILISFGFALGRHSRQAQIDTLTSSVAVEKARADGNAAVLQSLKEKLVEERLRRAAMQSAAERTLANLTNEVARLSRAAMRNEADLRKKASNDENCIPLRDLPVCSPLADGLWGDASRVRPR